MTPEFLLFVQHGWADDNRAMLALAHQLVQETVPVVAPKLDYVQTWLRVEPLIQAAEAEAIAQLTRYPNTPIRMIGHSMGGLIWLEVLNRHPDWWANIQSLVLVASPVGGADLGRILDPLALGIGIAADLGKNRKPLAETIAAAIPTLVIAGDTDGGSDGTVTVACTQFAYAKFICLPGVSHAAMRNHPLVAAVIREFWLGTAIGESVEANAIIQKLRHVPGITDGHQRDFIKAKVEIELPDGSTIRTWKNMVGVDHVFVASPSGHCLYAGFVGWLHASDLQQTLEQIKQDAIAL